MALVTHVLGDCPACKGEKSFGNIDVRGKYVSLGCKHCSYKERVELPEIRKQVLYLDQFFLSTAFRATDHRLTSTADKIANLCARQLLVVPYSSVHEQETHQWKHRDELLDFIKQTSRGHQFRPDYDIERRQLERAFDSWLSNDPPDYQLFEGDAFENDIHSWDSYIWIDVGRYLGDREQIRKLKRETVEELVELFETWRASDTTFDEDLGIEFRDAANVYWQSYGKYMERLAGGDFDAIIDAPLHSQIVKHLLRRVPEDVAEEKQHRMVADFLVSDHFRQSPRMDIGCRLFAGLRAIVKDGAYSNAEKAKKRLSGIFQDVIHVETYAPYCDAFIADQAMAELMTRPHVDIGARYGVEIFSLSNWDDLHQWLDRLAEGETKEHRAALSQAYPDLGS